MEVVQSQTYTKSCTNWTAHTKEQNSHISFMLSGNNLSAVNSSLLLKTRLMFSMQSVFLKIEIHTMLFGVFGQT